jgi:surface-anchored protein
MTRYLFTAVCAIGIATATSAGNYTEGHADVGLAYDGGWDLHIHVEGAWIGGVFYADEEFEPHEITTLAPPASVVPRPAGSQWDPIGNSAGEDTWILPQVELPGVPFLGIGTEEIAPGDFVNDQVTLALVNMTAPTGADFSLWQTDQFGDPSFYWSTADGISAADTVTLSTGTHGHYNWGFTTSGTYEVTLEAAGTHAIDGYVTGQATYFFQVVPEPGALALLAVLGVFAARRR